MSGLLVAEAELRVLAEPRRVLEAIVDPAVMSRYFITSGSERLEVGRTVRWVFSPPGVEVEVRATRVEAGRIEFVWAAGGVEAEVRMLLEPSEGGTTVSVTESGWPRNEAGVVRCVEQSKGWVAFLYRMKGYLEYQVDLRRGGPLGGAGKFVKS